MLTPRRLSASRGRSRTVHPVDLCDRHERHDRVRRPQMVGRENEHPPERAVGA